MDELFKKVEQEIKESNKILLVFTQNVDPDCFGSVFATYKYLKSIDKKVSVADYHGNIKTYFKRFPIEVKDLVNKKNRVKNFDLYISLDGMEMDRIGIDPKIVKGKIIHFDHHLFSRETEGIVVCDSNKASTTELLYDYFRYVDYKIPTRVADALLMGMISDTHNFQHGNASSDLLDKAGELLSISNDVYDICREYLYKKKIDDLRLLGEGLRRMKFVKEQGLVFSILTRKVLEKYGAEHKDLSMLSYFLNTTKGAKFSLLLTERKNGQIKGSLRSEKEKGVNVGEMAEIFKGGGHFAAAGFKLKGRIRKEGKGEWRII